MRCEHSRPWSRLKPLPTAANSSAGMALCGFSRPAGYFQRWWGNPACWLKKLKPRQTLTEASFTHILIWIHIVQQPDSTNSSRSINKTIVLRVYRKFSLGETIQPHLECWAFGPFSKLLLELCKVSERFFQRSPQRGRDSSPGRPFCSLWKKH